MTLSPLRGMCITLAFKCDGRLPDTLLTLRPTGLPSACDFFSGDEGNEEGCNDLIERNTSINWNLEVGVDKR